jgi:hypothetical protein
LMGMEGFCSRRYDSPLTIQWGNSKIRTAEA